MDIKDLKTLVKLITETDITEFEIENADEKILIKRGSNQQIIYAQAPAVQPQSAPAALQAAPPAAVPVAETLNANQKTINSPIVGTFYRKPSPEADAFVEVGKIVEAGATVCLVEAMKMFNEIEAEFKCKIIEILKADAEPVEYGDPLFVVEPV